MRSMDLLRPLLDLHDRMRKLTLHLQGSVRRHTQRCRVELGIDHAICHVDMHASKLVCNRHCGTREPVRAGDLNKSQKERNRDQWQVLTHISGNCSAVGNSFGCVLFGVVIVHSKYQPGTYPEHGRYHTENSAQDELDIRASRGESTRGGEHSYEGRDCAEYGEQVPHSEQGASCARFHDAQDAKDLASRDSAVMRNCAPILMRRHQMSP